MALSGGSTPKLLFELLASPGFQGRVRWSNLQLFQVDERCVPPDDPQSNYRMIRQALLESVPLPEENFHRMAAERPDREQAAREYAEELARVLRPARGSGRGWIWFSSAWAPTDTPHRFFPAVRAGRTHGVGHAQFRRPSSTPSA